ncbi:MAG: histidine--tRNA ligase, partial [Solirubrobacteraceae bacterium]
ARRILEPAGYGRIETPTFEATELFARGVGESTDIVQKEMYSFEDAGGRSLTLRPEGTAPVCRAYLEHGMHTLAQPVKLWYLGRYYRQEKPQKGRFRQFWQLGAEVIGSDDPAVDAELIALLHRLLGELEVRGLRLRLGSLGSLLARAEYRERLATYLHEHADRLSGDVRERIDLNPLRAFDAKDPGTQAVMRDAPLLLHSLGAEDREHFDEVCARLRVAGIDWELDGTLVRGIDYYTRTIFEFTSDALGAQSGVAGGGRYDGLIELLGGPPTPGMGWAAGLERMRLAAGERVGGLRFRPVTDLFVAHEDRGVEAFALAAEARAAGLAVQQELAGRSLKGQLKQADRAGARYVAIVGADGTQLRDMDSGEQAAVESAAAAVARVIKGRHAG